MWKLWRQKRNRPHRRKGMILNNAGGVRVASKYSSLNLWITALSACCMKLLEIRFFLPAMQKLFIFASYFFLPFRLLSAAENLLFTFQPRLHSLLWGIHFFVVVKQTIFCVCVCACPYLMENCTICSANIYHGLTILLIAKS